MRAYGQKRKDHGCCPGHDKFPLEAYNCRTSEHARARDKRTAHKCARARAKQALIRACAEGP